MRIPFIKAHGAQNDFLLTWREQVTLAGIDASRAPEIARAICDRHTGAGADGWIVISPGTAAADAAIELWNSDGSRSEISGNGTRCAAALLIETGRAGEPVRIQTGAGTKVLSLKDRQQRTLFLEMKMGCAKIEERHASMENCDATILNVGNPQCAVFVENFDLEWRVLGARIERHPHFPHRTNVSFVRVVDSHTLDVRFYERGAGETMSSGTGSTGAGAAALARGLVDSPVTVLTPAGPLQLRWEEEEMFLTGPAEIVASGEFYLHG